MAGTVCCQGELYPLNSEVDDLSTAVTTVLVKVDLDYGSQHIISSVFPPFLHRGKVFAMQAKHV